MRERVPVDRVLPEGPRRQGAPLNEWPREVALSVLAAMANLNAGALASAMGTGIDSTTLYVNDAGTDILRWAALARFAVLVPAYGWRLLRRRERFVADLLGPRAFAVAGAFPAFGTLGSWCWTTAFPSCSSPP
ncbi:MULTISPECIES: hypothetical protein [unclassified Streptomyces]|uniref:hypothetical protein n=1 Tax=unclassified Streptomyces TaxID=2593676 RepID=UPI0004C7389F|nr:MULTISPECIES: hypothetical protein [unclassified Streptomyces]KOV72985.1 hypothetical protein ADL02_41520 [Streptomyces sp. NRRL WC-3723]